MKCECTGDPYDLCKRCRLVALYNNLRTPFARNAIKKIMDDKKIHIMSTPSRHANKQFAAYSNLLGSRMHDAIGIPKKPEKDNVIAVDFKTKRRI